MTLSPAAERALAEIIAAAIAGERCPTNQSRENPAGTLATSATTELIRAGRIRTEVYAHNWRVIEILEGAHTGKRTKAPPNPKWRPYLIVDKNGSLRRDKNYAQASARKITLPTVNLRS